MVRFQTFNQFHGRPKASGSTYIRVEQLLKHWPEADLYRYGEAPDVLVFQKVYCSQDYKFPAHYPGIKILDISDPDWLEGMLIRETVDAMDAVTCPTEALQKFLQQLTDKPVVVVKDRFDLEPVPTRKPHQNKATKVIWFGYRHNAELLKPAMRLINQLDLSLTIIANDDPMAWQWLDTRDEAQRYRYAKYRFVKYNEDTIYQELQKADFAILPKGGRPVDAFKSNNKTTKSILAGLPVATTADDMRRFMDAKEREKEMTEKYDKIREEYDCKRSVAEMKELITRLQEARK